MLFERKNTVQGQFTGPVFFGSRKKRLLLFGVLIVLVSIFLWYETEKVLVIQAKNSNIQDRIVNIPDGKWYLSYTHSVQKTLVEEFFQVQEQGFLLYETRFSSYGVGLPFLATDGKLKIMPDGRMQLLLQRTFPLVKVWTGQEAKIELKTKNETLELYKIYPAGSLLEINVLPRYKIFISNF